MFRLEYLCEEGWKLEEAYHNMASAKVAANRSRLTYDVRIVDQLTGDIFTRNAGKPKFKRIN